LKDEIEKKNQLCKRIKKEITIKRTVIKIEIQNKFDIWLKGEIEKKDQFNKRLKKQNQKNEDQIENIIYDKLRLNDEI